MGVDFVNEKFDNLLYASGLTAQGCWDEMDEYDRTAILKFGELIVQECIQTLRDHTPFPDEDASIEDWDRGYIRAIVDCEYHIQEHFGVDS